MRTALIDDTGTLVNLVLAETDWQPPDGLIAVFDPPPEVTFGWRLKDGTWTNTLEESQEQKTVRITLLRESMSVSPIQARLAINAAGLRPQLDAWANDPDRTQDERDFLEYALIWHRTSPVVAAGAAALGLDDDDIDRLFAFASTF